MAKAMEFALEKLNSSFRFEATFNSKEIRESINCIKCMSNFSVFGIGPIYPRDLSYLLETDGTFVSYYPADAQTLHDTSSVYSIVPVDSFRIRALVDLVRKLEWKYISIISSYGGNGQKTAESFVEKIMDSNVACIDEDIELPLKNTKKSFEYIETINSSAIISFTMGRDTVSVIEHLNAKRGKKPQVLFAFGTIYYDEIGKKRSLHKAANGSLFVDFHSKEIPEFSKYICQDTCNKSNNILSPPVWCSEFKSKISLCKKGRPKYPSYFFTPVHLVIRAVNSLATAVENSAKNDIEYLGLKARQTLVREYLHRNTKCHYILNNSSKFEDNNLIRYDIINFVSYGWKYKISKVGSWTKGRGDCDAYNPGKLQLNPENIVWMSKSKGRADKSRPGITCRQNEVRKRIDGITKGRCWKCFPCERNDVITNNTCTLCNRDSKPDQSFRSCVILPRKTLDIETSWQAKLIFVVDLTSLVPVFFVCFIFLKHRNCAVVKASGRELCTFILIGILLTFLSSIIFVIPPGKLICSLRQIFPGFSFCLCYAPLFLKVNRIYRIFINSEKLKRTYMASSSSQVFLVLTLAALQLAPGCIWIIRNAPEPTMEYPDHRNFVVLRCPIDHSGFFINLILGVICMLGSTWYAFKTRSFPRNFNEAKHIGVSLYIICLIWALFIPGFLFVKSGNEFANEYMICCLCIAVGFTTLTGLFLQKVRRILNTSSKYKNSSTIRSRLSTTFSYPPDEISDQNPKVLERIATFNRYILHDTSRSTPSSEEI